MECGLTADEAGDGVVEAPPVNFFCKVIIIIAQVVQSWKANLKVVQIPLRAIFFSSFLSFRDSTKNFLLLRGEWTSAWSGSGSRKLIASESSLFEFEQLRFKEIQMHVGRTADLIALMLEEVHIYHKFHYG